MIIIESFILSIILFFMNEAMWQRRKLSKSAFMDTFIDIWCFLCATGGLAFLGIGIYLLGKDVIEAIL